MRTNIQQNTYSFKRVQDEPDSLRQQTPGRHRWRKSPAKARAVTLQHKRIPAPDGRVN